MQQKIILPPYDIALVADDIKDEEIKNIPGALNYGKVDIDPVTFSVVLARMEGIMSEMTETILASARNPILYGAKDFTCTLMNERAKVLSLFDCIPAHIGSMPPALRFVIRAFENDIAEGDVIVNNASFAGNAHVGDWTMFAPVFYEGKFVTWVVNKCHIIDVGAAEPTTGNALWDDAYKEGLHFPGVRLCTNHEVIPDLIRFIGYNFRYSRQWYGDFLAQLGSLWVGESRIHELCDRFGYNVVRACFDETLNYGDRMMTEEIRKLPRITVEEEMLGEKLDKFCPDGLKLKMKLSIDPDKALIVFDYREMPDQLPFGYNLTYATAISSAIVGTLPILSPEIPLNDGTFSHIKVLLREGSIAGIPCWPVGTSEATTAICDQITNLVFKTWGKAIPERALAGMGEYSAVNESGAGFDFRSNEPYSHMFYLCASAAGATKGYDGLSHMFGHCIMGNMAYESIEIYELGVPHIVWATHAVTDSGGPGKWRGGIATGHKIQPRDHDMLLIYAGSGHTCAPFGLAGGMEGSTADHYLIDVGSGKVVKRLNNFGESTCQADQRWEAVAAGGGGFGNPQERDPLAVRDDVRDGFVSIEAARDIYKVAIDTDNELYSVNEEKTKELRTKVGGS